MTTPQALATSPQTFRERDAWIRAVLAADLPHVAVRIAVAIALYLRVSTGQCNPSYPTLAAASRVSERSSYRLVDLLEHRGWLAITRLTGRVNQYTLITPANPMAVATPANIVSGASLPNLGGIPAKSDDPPLPNRAGTPATTLAVNKRYKRRKRTAGKEVRLTTPDFGLDFEEGVCRGKEEASKPKARADLAERFEEFWRVYPRKVAKLAAKKAFDAAIKRGIDPEVLIAGAKRYEGERAGQDPKYTKHAATWLNAGCYLDEPAPRADGPPVIDQEGNVVQLRQERPHNSGGGWAAAAERLIASGFKFSNGGEQ